MDQDSSKASQENTPSKDSRAEREEGILSKNLREDESFEEMTKEDIEYVARM
jgi:hypothetical protein